LKLLLIGINTRAITESALKSIPREKILALDYFGDYDQQKFCESYSLKRAFQRSFTTQNLLQASKKLSFDRIIYTANLENYPSLVKNFHERSFVLGNAPSTLSQVRNPKIFFAFLKKAGIPHPRTYFEDRGSWIESYDLSEQRDPQPSIFNPSDLAQDTLQSSKPAFLQKPILSGGGFGIGVLGAIERSDHSIVQEYLEGTPCSALFIANGQDSVLVGLTEQLIGCKAFGSQGFRYCGNILGKICEEDIDSNLIPRLSEIIKTLTQEFQLKGANGIDFILKDGVPYVLEVNPRYTAAMELVEKAYNLNIVEAHLKAFEGYLPSFNLMDHIAKGYWGKAILFAEETVVVPSIQEAWFERGVRDIPLEGETISQGDPICTLFAKDACRDVCYSELVERANALKAELAPVF
jgi:predicted ATP-grasp superfamily ATP-dependent carboligase